MGRSRHPFFAHWPACLVALAGIMAYWGTLLSGIKVWSGSPDEQHGFLVIPVALVLLYLRRGSFPGLASDVDLRGLLLMACAAGLRIYSEQYIRPWMDIWSLPLWIGGIVWTLGGWPVFRWAAPAVAFLFFMAPLPGQVQNAAGFPLQVIAATGGGWLLQMIGQPAFVAGTTILLGEHVLDVERACSGLRMFHGMLAVSVAWSLFSQYRWPRFLILLAIAPLIAVLVNILRIAVTGLLFQYVSGEAAQSFTHDWAGLLMIPAGALAFFVIDAIFDRLSLWNRERPDRWLMTAAAVSVAAILLSAGGYAIHARQQDRAIELVLKQARDLSSKEPVDERLAAVELFQRYLTARPADAAVISELAGLHAGLGGEHLRRAARLYELAWRADPSRYDDALGSLTLLSRSEAWQPLWEFSNEVVGQLSGPAKITTLRLRSLAISQLNRSGAAVADVDKMFAACREACRLDEAHFEHTWQLATLTRLHPGRSRAEDLATNEPASVASTEAQSAPVPAPLSGDAAIDPLTKFLNEADLTALAIIDRYIARRPDQPRPQLYRVSLLESIQSNLTPAQRETVDVTIAATLEGAMALIAEQYPLDIESVSTAGSADVAAEETAAFAYLIAGRRVLRAGDRTGARKLLSRSQSLGPRNYQVYLLLAETLPRDDHQQRITLFKTGLERTGTRELALILPLAEAYLATGREADAEALLTPLESLLPNLANVDRGRVELMLASTRASGLAQQGRTRQAADRLAAAFNQQSVLSQRRNFPALYARVQFQLGSLYRSLNQEAAAAAAFQEGGRFAPDSPIWHLDAARAHEATGNLAAALDQYQRAAAIIGRQQPVVYLSIANVLLGQQRQATEANRDLEAVRSMIRIAIDRGADNALACALLAETFVVAGDLDTAKRIINQQLSKTPQSPRLIFSRALIQQLAGDVTAALADVESYRAAGATDAEALTLKTLLLDRAGRLDEALEMVQLAGAKFNAEELNVARTQLVLSLFRQNRIDEATEQLKSLARVHPDDLPIQQLAADLFADLRLDTEAEQAEQNLQRLEGEKGALWRASRAARLLRTASSPEHRREAEALVKQLEQLLPDWPRTAILRGQFAEQSGRWAQALAAYESAWSAGTRDASLAVRILTALNRTGQGDRAVQYVNQLEDLVPQSTSLFDRAMPQYVSGDKSDYVLQLARRWAQSDPTPDNLVRLGQTLLTIASSSRAKATLQSPEAAIDEAEQAFEAAIAGDPGNVSAWIAAFQLQAGLRQDRAGALAKLQQLSEQLQIEPLQRAFVLAQLYTAIGEGARAGEAFDQAVELASGSPPADQELVMLTAARFFADRRADRAIQLCRQLLTQNPASTAAQDFLIRQLATQNTLETVSEAIDLSQSLTVEDPTNHKRLRSQLLMMRATLRERATHDSTQAVAGDGNRRIQLVTSRSQRNVPTAQQDRLEALALMNGITPRTAEDAALLGDLLVLTGQPLQAFNTYRESLRLESPTVDRLARCLAFWNKQYAAEGTYRPLADQYYKDLLSHPNAAPIWLKLKLERAAIEFKAATKQADAIAGSATGSLHNQSTGSARTSSPTNVSIAAPDETTDRRQPSLQDNEREILQQFQQAFVPVPSDSTFSLAITQLVAGLSAADRLDLLPLAIELVSARQPARSELGSALSIAAIHLSQRDADPHVVVAELIKTVPSDADVSGSLLSSVGDALYVCGNPDLAAMYYRSALNRSADDVQTLNSLAIVLAELEGDAAETLQLADRTIELDPENPDRRDTKLTVAMLTGRWKLAEEIAATLSNERSGLILLHLAYLALQQNKPREAIARFNQACDAGVKTQLYAPCDKMMYQTLAKELSN